MPTGTRSQPRLDYDQIAELYDEPLRDYAADPHLAAYFQGRSADAAGRVRVLDVGCGTGKQILANRNQWPGLALAGVDRSERMLRIAQKRCPRAWWTQADGAALPFHDRLFDYVTSQFSYHHVGRTGELLREVFRVLAPRGRFVMTNIDPWTMRGWLVYEYFREAFALDARDFLQVEAFVAQMRKTGFADVRVTRTDLSRTQTLREFLAYASERHRASQFMAVSDEAYRAGLRRLEHEVGDRGGAAGDLVRSEFVLVTVAGDRPPGETK